MKNFYNPISNKEGQISRLVVENQLIPLCIYTTKPEVEIYKNTPISINKIGVLMTTNGYGQGCWRFSSTTDRTEVFYYTDKTLNYNTLMLNKYTKKTKKIKILYFLTRWGGWDWTIFTDYDIIYKSVDKKAISTYNNIYGDKSIYHTSKESERTLRLYGIPYHNSFNNNIEELINSNTVYDENNERVKVLTDNFNVTDTATESPSITISYLGKNIITH